MSVKIVLRLNPLGFYSNSKVFLNGISFFSFTTKKVRSKLIQPCPMILKQPIAENFGSK